MSDLEGSSKSKDREIEVLQKKCSQLREEYSDLSIEAKASPPP